MISLSCCFSFSIGSGLSSSMHWFHISKKESLVLFTAQFRTARSCVALKVFFPQGSSLLHLRIVVIVPRGAFIFHDHESPHSGNTNSLTCSMSIYWAVLTIILFIGDAQFSSEQLWSRNSLLEILVLSLSWISYSQKDKHDFKVPIRLQVYFKSDLCHDFDPHEVKIDLPALDLSFH